SKPPADCGCSSFGVLPAASAPGSTADILAAGRRAQASGDRQAALGLFSQAADKARVAGNTSLAADAILELTAAMSRENLCRDGLAVLEQALQMPGLPAARQQQLRLVLADFQLRAGRPRRAFDLLNGDFGQIRNAAVLVPMIRSRVLLELRDPADDTQAFGYEKAFAELSPIREQALADASLRAEFLLLTAAEQGDMGRAADARATLAELANVLASDPHSAPPHAVAALRLLAGLGDAPASDLALRLRDLALGGDSADEQIRSMADGYFGQVAEAQGAARLPVALEATRRALLPSSRGLDPGLAMLWNWQLARLLEQQGEVTQADARYQAAIALAATPRLEESLPSGLPPFCTHERPQDLYRDYADFLLLHAAAVRPSPEAAWRDALAVMNNRRELRIRDFLQDQCLASLVGREKSVDAVAPGSAVLHVLVLPNRTEVLLQVKSQLYRHVVESSEKDFLAQVESFHSDIVNAPSPRYRTPARQLYDWLICPFEPHLAGVDTLVIATDGPLQLIPFGALFDGKDFLIQRFALATTPSLHLIDARATQLKNASILGLGLNENVQVGTEIFPALPGADRELGALRALPARSRIMVNAEFTPKSFQQALADKPFSIVHVVSHATVGSDPEDFFIVSNQGKIDLDGLDQAIRPTLYRQQPLELLVLSACETAVGDDRTALGLAGVAMKAGARSTMASLWLVNDESSTECMTAFYANWFGAGNPSKAQALQKAQLSLLEQIRYRHPKYWAPYILIGNWQ
ncbi:MAG TPA: CHAT domain-containing protein, partial [Phycisphaerae bacterium]|nr:CHAT domain-containing protein [Phycisphaerae bacterium]